MKVFQTAIFVLLTAGFSSCGSKSTPISSTAPGTASSAGEVKLTWNATANASGYLIEQSSDKVTFTQAQTVAAPTVAATVSGLTGGQLYYFRIQAYNSGGDSGFSNVASATP